MDNYINTVKFLLPQSQNSSQPDEEDIKTMKMGEIRALYSGAYKISQATDEDYTLKDMLDPNKVTDEEFDRILYKFKYNYDRLDMTMKKLDCVLDLGGDGFFWIPVDILP